jgi:hypothetical protein
MHEFEGEYLKFPRASHDDIMDALASINEIYFPPVEERKVTRAPNPIDKDYESHYIRNLGNKRR